MAAVRWSLPNQKHTTSNLGRALESPNVVHRVLADTIGARSNCSKLGTLIQTRVTEFPALFTFSGFGSLAARYWVILASTALGGRSVHSCPTLALHRFKTENENKGNK
jgi:hypothetical protein